MTVPVFTVEQLGAGLERSAAIAAKFRGYEQQTQQKQQQYKSFWDNVYDFFIAVRDVGIQLLSWMHRQVTWMLTAIVDRIKKLLPILKVPEQAFRDAIRWLKIRDLLISGAMAESKVGYQDLIDPHKINEDLSLSGDPGWSGVAATTYKNTVLPRQHAAAGSLAGFAIRASGTMVGYASNVAAVITTITIELVSIGFKIEELGKAVLTRDRQKMADAVYEVWKQVRSSFVIVGGVTASIEVGLRYNQEFMEAIPKEMAGFMNDGTWPDPTRYADFPAVSHEGGGVQRNPRPVPALP